MNTQKQVITIHADGAGKGDPGPGGFAAIIELPDGNEVTITGSDPSTTNDRIELAAVIESIDMVGDCDVDTNEIIVRSDSKYIVDAFQQGWLNHWQRNAWRTANKEAVPNQDLWKRMLKVTADYEITWVWAKGHSGDPMNEKCDQLAVAEAGLAPHTSGYRFSAFTEPASGHWDSAFTEPADGDTAPQQAMTAHQLAQLLLDMPADAVVLTPASESGYYAVTASDIHTDAAVIATPNEPHWRGEYRKHQDGGLPAVIISTLPA